MEREIKISEELKKKGKEIFNSLTDKEYTVLKLRFGLESDDYKTLDDVSKILNITRERVHQIEEKALHKLDI